ncbi:MAG: lipid II flippase MurJ, partial [Raoultibacter sp.]
MPDKLSRAKHTREAVEKRLCELPESTGPLRSSDSIDRIQGKHARLDVVSIQPLEPEIIDASDDMLGRTSEPESTAGELVAPAESTAGKLVSSSAALISICVIISRITGFVRTWAMAFALGSTLLSSSYQVANNLPNQLYELVMGGMLVTAFLPVYLSVKKKLGNDASNAYASNLLSIVVIFLGVVSLICMSFPA